MKNTEEKNNRQQLYAVVARLNVFIDKNYEGKWTVFARDIGAAAGAVKAWLGGKSWPGGQALASMAAVGLDVQWLLTGKESEAPTQASDAAELERLREQVARLTREADLNLEVYGEAVRSRSKLQEEKERLQAELNRLRAENQALRAQAASAALSREEAQLLTEVADALGVPVDRGLAGVLERVRANLAAVGILSPPTVHDPSGDSGKTGGRPSVEPGPASKEKKAGGA
jgi:predicted TIM-barrel fold metal-dependent hydrolase